MNSRIEPGSQAYADLPIVLRTLAANPALTNEELKPIVGGRDVAHAGSAARERLGIVSATRGYVRLDVAKYAAAAREQGVEPAKADANGHIARNPTTPTKRRRAQTPMPVAPGVTFPPVVPVGGNGHGHATTDLRSLVAWIQEAMAPEGITEIVITRTSAKATRTVTTTESL